MDVVFRCCRLNLYRNLFFLSSGLEYIPDYGWNSAEYNIMCHSWQLSSVQVHVFVLYVKLNIIPPFVLEIHSSPKTVHIHYTPLIFTKGYIAFIGLLLHFILTLKKQIQYAYYSYRV